MKSKNNSPHAASGLTTNQIACHAALTVLVAVAVVLLSGCSRRYHDVPAYLPFGWSDYENESVGRFKTSYLAEQIDEYYKGMNPGPIGVTTFVNVDDLQSTSTFGRMYAEQLMSELAMRGFDVIELRHSDALQFINASGEFALSRHPGLVKRQYDLGGVIVGTYVVSPVRVYVNARLLDPSTGTILSAGSVEMGKNKEIGRLLRGGAFASTLERIPVRHLGLSTYPLSLYPNQQGTLYDLEESGAPVRAKPWSEHQSPVPAFVEPPKPAKKK